MSGSQLSRVNLRMSVRLHLYQTIFLPGHSTSSQTVFLIGTRDPIILYVHMATFRIGSCLLCICSSYKKGLRKFHLETGISFGWEHNSYLHLHWSPYTGIFISSSPTQHNVFSFYTLSKLCVV